MSEFVSFKGRSIVSCGTMRQEIERLRRSGLLDVDRVFYACLLYTSPSPRD